MRTLPFLRRVGWKLLLAFTDIVGMNDPEPLPPFKNEIGEWGSLPAEPCRFCHQIGGVKFRIDDSPRGKNEPQVVRCDKCGRDWEAESPLA